ncbi:CRE-SRW-87 protein [Caenorhabditis remanei]|uniref:CRE-SRW-87 protein n=1 Tax=Caenorhabditis remanei TaxID=31234 RepID=E3N7B6_CAERE|nr:CRE-SRW-87 protein [Caenorhabditis remanei]
MRTTSMNSILLGIALADMIFPLVAIKKKVRIWIIGSNECIAPESILEMNFDWLLYTLRDDFRRCSTWLGLMLAGVRTIAVRNSMNQSCSEYELGHAIPNLTFQERDFYKAANGLLRKINLLVVGGLAKFLPCILFPALTIVLIRELRKARKVREAAKKEVNAGKRKELTTRLVIYMTISFFAIEFPIGICFWVEAASSAYNEGNVTTSIIQLLNMIYVVMTLTHFSICFFMSSQYRKTVKMLFTRGISMKNQTMSVVSVIQNARSGNSSNM